METTMCAKCQRETIRLRTGQCMACAGDEFIRLCTHREAEGACDICAADADRDRKAADYDRLAGEVERLTRERDEARALATKLNEKLDETHLHRCRFCEATVTAETSRAQEAEARAEALAAALREVTEIVVDCRRDVALTYSDGIIGDAIARAEAALSAAPPADLTRHPAYRAGYRAGIEAAAAIVDNEARMSSDVAAKLAPEHPEHAALWVTRASYERGAASRIRALLDTPTPPATLDRTTAERAAEVCLGRAVKHANAGDRAAETEARLCADEITRALVGEVRDGE